jgi:hypothetical protein
MVISRPEKLSHTQTMLYEIDMLRETAQKLSKNNWNAEKDKWTCLESFLLHFRNLIEFFGRPDPRGDDLHITKPDAFWPEVSQRPAEAVREGLVRRDLWDEYEDAKPDRISKYLHHCTETRIETKEWKVGEMFGELQPTLISFESLVLDRRRPWETVQGAEIPRSVTGATGPGAPPAVK